MTLSLLLNCTFSFPDDSGEGKLCPKTGKDVFSRLKIHLTAQKCLFTLLYIKKTSLINQIFTLKYQ